MLAAGLAEVLVHDAAEGAARGVGVGVRLVGLEDHEADDGRRGVGLEGLILIHFAFLNPCTGGMQGEVGGSVRAAGFKNAEKCRAYVIALSCRDRRVERNRRSPMGIYYGDCRLSSVDSAKLEEQLVMPSPGLAEQAEQCDIGLSGTAPLLA